MNKNELLVQSLHKSIVKENLAIYREMFCNTELGERATRYWVKASNLFESLTDTDKEAFFKILEQTMIDTISTFLGIIDGNVTLSGNVEPPKLYYDGKDVSDEMQDLFLEFIEDMKDD